MDPEAQKYYGEGYRNYQSGYEIEENPYEGVDDFAADYWDDGWLAAEEDEGEWN